MKSLLRLANDSDLPTILEVHARAFERDRSTDGKDGNLAAVLTKKGMRTSVLEDPSTRAMQGFISAGARPYKEMVSVWDMLAQRTQGGWPALPETIGYISELAVDPSAQGLGLGSLLLRVALEQLRMQGLRTMLVFTSEKLRSAVQLYERFGFRRLLKRIVDDSTPGEWYWWVLEHDGPCAVANPPSWQPVAATPKFHPRDTVPAPSRGKYLDGLATAPDPTPSRGKSYGGLATARDPTPSIGKYYGGLATARDPTPSRGKYYGGLATARDLAVSERHSTPMRPAGDRAGSERHSANEPPLQSCSVASGPWSTAQSYSLGGEESRYAWEGKVQKLDVGSWSSISSAVNALNKGTLVVEAGIFTMFSTSMQSYYVLFRKDKQPEAMDLLRTKARAVISDRKTDLDAPIFRQFPSYLPCQLQCVQAVA